MVRAFYDDNNRVLVDAYIHNDEAVRVFCDDNRVLADVHTCNEVVVADNDLRDDGDDRDVEEEEDMKEHGEYLM